jgi:glutaredoxin 3
MQQPQDGHVTMYVTTFCPYCVRAKALLQRKGVAFSEINLDGDHEARHELIRMSGGLRTVPQIFVGPVHVGGCDELYAMDRAGTLEPLLDEQGVAFG